MMLRRLLRAVALAVALARCIVRYWLARTRGTMTLERRGLWLQDASRLVLASMGVHYKVEGVLPARGLVVANHLSYLDVPILSAAMPCFFVAKSEVKKWPVFGRAARCGGTLFLDRASADSANDVAQKISSRLQLRIPVVLFPEGTTTDGGRVLPFHSRLIQPAAATGAFVTPIALRYYLEGGEERDLCWYGDASFVPHLWKVLGAKNFSVSLRCGESRVYSDRREAAEATREEIIAMRANRASEKVAF